MFKPTIIDLTDKRETYIIPNDRPSYEQPDFAYTVIDQKPVAGGKIAWIGEIYVITAVYLFYDEGDYDCYLIRAVPERFGNDLVRLFYESENNPTVFKIAINRWRTV